MKKKATTKRMLALIALFMTACMLFLAVPVFATEPTFDTWDGTYNRSALSGEGTEANPFIIDSAEKLMGLAKNVICSSDSDVNKREGGAWTKNGARVSKVFKLTVNIDFEGQEIIPIGVGAGKIFSGVFNGDNHTIKNFKVASSVTATKPNGETITSLGTNGVISLSSHQALFGYLNSDTTAIPTVKNLTVTGAIMNTGAKQSPLVAQARGTLNIENCHTSNTTWHSSANYIGGIVAEAGNASAVLNISNCTSDISVTLNTTSDCRVGGIVGYAAKSTTVNNCTVTTAGINVTGTSAKTLYVGGIVAHTLQACDLKIDNCSVTSKNSGAFTLAEVDYVGGIIASNGTTEQTEKTTITNCYTNVNINATNVLAAGGVAGSTKGALTVENCTSDSNIRISLLSPKLSLQTTLRAYMRKTVTLIPLLGIGNLIPF